MRRRWLWKGAGSVCAVALGLACARHARASGADDGAWAAEARQARSCLDRANAASGAAGMVMAEPTHAVEARLGLVVDVPALTPTSWVVFATVPPTMSGQRVMSFAMTPSTTQIADQRDAARKLRMAVLSAGEGPEAHKLRMGAVYKVQLFKRTFLEGMRAPGRERAPTLSAAEMKGALEPVETLDFAGPAFQGMLTESGLRPREGEGEVAFAKRAFVTLRGVLHYNYRPEMDRHSSVVWKAGKSDCGGINGLFVSVMRANGIPARTLCGRWAKSAEAGATLGGVAYLQWHVKAEMFVHGAGWIPVDLCGAVQAARAGDDGLAYFGKDEGDFLVMHVGFDLLVDTMGLGRQNVMADQGFAYWVRGQGKMDGRTKQETWTVQDIAILQASR